MKAFNTNKVFRTTIQWELVFPESFLNPNRINPPCLSFRPWMIRFNKDVDVTVGDAVVVRYPRDIQR